MKRHLFAEGVEMEPRADAWEREWIADQPNRHAPDPQSLHADLVDSIGVIYSKGS